MPNTNVYPREGYHLIQFSAVVNTSSPDPESVSNNDEALLGKIVQAGPNSELQNDDDVFLREHAKYSPQVGPNLYICDDYAVLAVVGREVKKRPRT